MEKHLKNEYAKMWIEDGIYYCEYKDGILTTIGAEIVVKDRIAFQANIPYVKYF